MIDNDISKTFPVLKKALTKELRNHSLSVLKGSNLGDSWLVKTWNKITKADLAVGSNEGQYLELLKLAKKQTLPLLEVSLDANSFRSLIMEIILKVLERRTYKGRPDVLYAIELALELSRQSQKRPTYLMLLNAFHRNSTVLKTFDAILDAELAVLNKSAETSELGAGLGDVAGAPSSEVLLPRESLPFTTESQILSPKDLAFDELEDKPVTPKQSKDTERRSQDLVIKLWHELELKVKSRVARLRARCGESENEMDAIWHRQRWFESMMAEVFEDCDIESSPTLQAAEKTYFPAFKSQMASRISTNPALARKMYDTLELLLEAEPTLGHFVHVAAMLSATENIQLVNAIYEDLSYSSLGKGVCDHILAALDKPHRYLQGK
jgi:hypothetical protein